MQILVPRPSTAPVFDQYCKRSKTGGVHVEGLGMRLCMQTNMLGILG